MAAAVAGFAGEMQLPNGRMLTKGTLSRMLPAGWPSVSTLFLGSTTSVLEARPIGHISVAPLQTWLGMAISG